MARYINRVADHELRRALATFGAVIIQGPRAVGKTTTASQHANSTVRLDESPEVQALASTSPATVLAGAPPRLIDEWQLAPQVWNTVRHEVDKRGLSGQFILTGSATPTDEITRHSGAGRFKRLTLRPLSLAESGDSTATIGFYDLFNGLNVAGIGGPTVEEYASLIVRGGWPALVRDARRNPTEYLLSYLDDVSRVDMPANDMRIDPLRMNALVRALSRNVATEIPASRLSLEAELGGASASANGISAQSVRKYLDALSRVFVLEEQPAWAPQLRSRVRVRVSPKWHFVDPSLAAAALGASKNHLLDDLRTLALFFESLCVRDLRVYAGSLGAQVFHYRDETGLEVDCIIENQTGDWAAVEIKLGGQKPIDEGATNLKKLAGKVSDARRAQLRSLTVLTAGNVSYTRPDGINVVALGHLKVDPCKEAG